MDPFTARASGWQRWLIIVACVGMASCGPDRTASTSGASGSPPARSTPSTLGAEPGAAAVANAPQERYTLEQIALALRTMQKCVDEDTRAMAMCACRSDLTLSRTPAPPDVAAYCAAYADRFVATTMLSGEAQERSPYQLVAPDVVPGSFLLFSVAVPCLIDAIKEKSQDRVTACFCMAHALANRMAQHTMATQAEVAAIMQRAVREISDSGRCRAAGGH
jgi:hypothetical protein